MENCSMKMELGRTLKRIAVGGALAAFATSGFAATQGTTGFTSTGDLVISLIVNEEVHISNLTDIVLPTFTGADVNGTSGACIYRSGGTGLYQITGTGSGPANAFELTDATNSVNYSVTYDDGSGAVPMTSGLALNAANAQGVDDNCVGLGADNATIDVTVLAVDAGILPASTYTGTLTLLVAPL
jgi:hypothetical protein